MRPLATMVGLRGTACRKTTVSARISSSPPRPSSTKKTTRWWLGRTLHAVHRDECLHPFVVPDERDKAPISRPARRDTGRRDDRSCRPPHRHCRRMRRRWRRRAGHTHPSSSPMRTTMIGTATGGRQVGGNVPPGRDLCRGSMTTTTTTDRRRCRRMPRRNAG